MKFIIDTREQKDYSNFFRKLNYSYKVKKLDVGDYSLEGFESKFAIERKELNDFINCVTWERVRFSKTLEKAQTLEFFAVVIEASLFDILNRNYNSKAHPNAIVATLFKWMVKYNVKIILADSRVGGALAVVKLAEAFVNYKYQENLK